MDPMMSVEDALDGTVPSDEAPDDEKLRELILYISWMCEDDPTFGATKLNKILFFSDFRAYRLLGHSITGQEYQALEQGPAPRKLLPLRDALKREGALVIRERDFYDRRQSQTIALRSPDLSKFTPQELAIVQRVIDEWRGRTASEMSRASHEFVGWQLADAGETIPYPTALFEDHEPTRGELEFAAGLEQMALDALSEMRSQT